MRSHVHLLHAAAAGLILAAAGAANAQASPPRESVAWDRSESREHVRLIHMGHPEYDGWTARDFSKLSDQDIRIIRSAIAAGISTPDQYLPASFRTRFGLNAGVMFMQAVLAESDRRNIESAMARALLNWVYAGTGPTLLPIESRRALRYRPDVAVPYLREDGATVQATAPEILNYAIAQYAVSNQARELTIPPQVAQAFGATAGGLIPQSAIDRVFDLVLTDAMAFDSGFSTRAGLSRGISAPTMQLQYDRAQARAHFPQLVRDIYDPTKPDINTRDAWTAGWVAADMLLAGDADAVNTTLFGVSIP
jgi:hypothetical protein